MRGRNALAHNLTMAASRGFQSCLLHARPGLYWPVPMLAKPANIVQLCAGKSCDARHSSRKLQDSFRGLTLVIESQGF
ncbi:MAG: hypothetical protein JWQ61_874 [Collimonas fungivorans]|nr:hypothetical protein [Collimonas fungivorans]